jgi:hypothetical protein
MNKVASSNPQDGGSFRKGSTFGDGSRPPASRPGTSGASARKASFDIPRPFYDTISPSDATVAYPPLLTFSIFGRASRPLTPRPSTSGGVTSAKKGSLDIPRPSFDSVSPLDTSVTRVPSRQASISPGSKSPQNKSRSRRPSAGDRNGTPLPDKWPLPTRSKSVSQPEPNRSSERRQSVSHPLTDISAKFQGTQSRALKRLSISSVAPYANMLATSFSRDNKPGNMYQVGAFAGAAMVPNLPAGPQSPTLEAITYQHIQEMASKRISTLDYLRKAYCSPPLWKTRSNYGGLVTKGGCIGLTHYYSTSQT